MAPQIDFSGDAIVTSNRSGQAAFLEFAYVQFVSEKLSSYCSFYETSAYQKVWGNLGHLFRYNCQMIIFSNKKSRYFYDPLLLIFLWNKCLVYVFRTTFI